MVKKDENNRRFEILAFFWAFPCQRQGRVFRFYLFKRLKPIKKDNRYNR
jgi:hypothetical protein